MSRNNMPSYVAIYNEDDFGADGILEYRTSLQSTYDRQGNLTSTLYEFDSGADGAIDNRSLTRYEYDNKINVISALLKENSGSNGTNDHRAVRYSFDSEDMIASSSADLIPNQLLLQ